MHLGPSTKYIFLQKMHNQYNLINNELLTLNRITYIEKMVQNTSISKRQENTHVMKIFATQ